MVIGIFAGQSWIKILEFSWQKSRIDAVEVCDATGAEYGYVARCIIIFIRESI